MKKAFEATFLVMLLFSCLAVGLGYFFADSKPFETKVSQQTADEIAKKRAETEIQNSKNLNEITQYVYLGIGFSAVFLIITPASIFLSIKAYTAWAHRHDVKPDKHGFMPAVRIDIKNPMMNLNNGMRTDMQLSEQAIAQASKNNAFGVLAAALTRAGKMFSGSARSRERAIEDDLWPGEDVASADVDIEPAPQIGVHTPAPQLTDEGFIKWTE